MRCEGHTSQELARIDFNMQIPFTWRYKTGAAWRDQKLAPLAQRKAGKKLREVLEMAAYMLVDNRVLNQEDFNEYIEKIPQVVASYGGQFLVRGGAIQVVEGDYTPERIVVVEFDSLEQANTYASSPEYLELSVIRNRSTRTSTIIVDGV